MKAQQVEISWDQGRKNWVVRIQIGEEVVRRHARADSGSDDEKLRGVAAKVAQEEGYEFPVADVRVKR